MKSAFVALLLELFIVPFLYARTDGSDWDGTNGVEQTQYLLRVHEQHMKELSPQIRAASTQSTDVGNVAVIRADSKTLISPNRFDLAGKKISYTVNPAGGYNLKVSAGSVSANQGNPIVEGDDTSKAVPFSSGFSFPYYGKTYLTVFINSDGNLTFTKPDHASIDRSISRAVSGPPRICPFFADLNPGVSGHVNVLQTATKFTVTWNAVPDFDQTGFDTFQVNLFKNGN